MSERALEDSSVNTIRVLAIDAIQQANSGHPGLPLGAAPMAYVLWHKHLHHSPADPSWPDRDRFVMGAGHGSALVYALLHLTGYDLSIDELRAFRQWGSRTPGHPEHGVTPGVEATSGPLGQGSANVVGMAMAERFLANHYNRPGHEIVDHFTYGLISDGDLMEGVAAEAASLAGHLHLGKLICLYDANDITLDGPTSLSFDGEDVARRYQAYGWQVLNVADGDGDLAAIDAAIVSAQGDDARPSLIIIHTTIGYGSPNKAGTASAHGSPLGTEEVALTKKALGCDPEQFFHVPADVAAHLGAAVDRGRAAQAAWQEAFARYEGEHPDLAQQFKLALDKGLPAGWDDDLPQWPAGESLATRAAGGKVINAVAAKVPWLFGGDADLSCSTKTLIADGGDFDGQSGAGRNIRFGVREHAMASICNGLDYHGGVRPYCATFFVFADYMRPAIRLAALNGQPAIYVWTHDSVCVGEDGPTHQPVEHLMSLRVIVNVAVVRPCDANETREAWRYAMLRNDGPTALVLSRQKLPVLDRELFASAQGLHRGAYVLADGSDAIIIATGSEVEVALAARDELAGEGVSVRVVSMPCWEQFASEDADYRQSVLPAAVTARVSVEAGVTMGWRTWVGDRGYTVGIDRFGASAPGGTNLDKFGITSANVAARVRAVIASK